MKKVWEATYNNNHLKLMRIHQVFVLLYILLDVLLIYSFKDFGDPEVKFIETVAITVIYTVPFVLLHGALAYGAKKKLELSRKVSEIVFALILLGFPIGTLLSIFVLFPKTVWKQPE